MNRAPNLTFKKVFIGQALYHKEISGRLSIKELDMSESIIYSRPNIAYKETRR